jgi:glycosyltransferase involved in cell wall biosynthesis
MPQGSSPLVSIVIPVYNGEKYIQKAIDSVLNQSYSKIELIVLDDGSKDDTLNIIKKYNHLLYWETHSNMGQANTLNKGWQYAKGEILSYLSADDLLMSNAVSTSIKYLKLNPDVVLTYCDFNLIDPQSKIIRRVTPPNFNYYEMVVKIVCPPGPGVFFHRRAFEAAGLWKSDFRQMPDYDYWLRLGLLGNFFHIPELLAAFRVHDESQSYAKGDASKSDEPVRIISDYFQMPNIPESIIGAKNEALSNAYLTSAQLHWRAGRFKVGATNTKKALSLFPANFLTLKTFRLVANALFNRLGYRILWALKKVFASPSK